MADVVEAGFSQELAHLASAIATAFGDTHQQGRVGGDGGRAGLGVVQVGVMHDEEAARFARWVRPLLLERNAGRMLAA